ncbi:MAG: DUF47 family protein [Thermoflexales bacterium]|nr:DUF47 family protein [Thermoflexales bacterium]
MFGRKRKEEDRFIALLTEQAAKTVRGIEMLENCLLTPDQAGVDKLSAIEMDADETRRIMIDDLHNTFVTPIDREDLFNLSLYIDDMLDYAFTTLEELVFFGVQGDQHLHRMVSLVRQEAEQLHLACQRLSANPRVAGDHARRAKKLENEVDHLYRVAVADLYSKCNDPANLPALLKQREVYRHVSNMSDRADTAANVFGMVVMKLS